MRRAIERSFNEVSDDFRSVTTKTDKEESLALKRYQFLLMGASGNG